MNSSRLFLCDHRTIGKDNGGVLLELLSPQVVTSILTSQQLLHKRYNKNNLFSVEFRECCFFFAGHRRTYRNF